MSDYKVIIARAEVRVYSIVVEANSEKEAEVEAWKAWDDGEDFGEGDCVHSEEHIEKTELLEEQRA